jgi:hypothetical protein
MARVVPAEESKLVLRADGSFWHDGAPATHAGLRRFLHRHIRRDEAGRHYLHNAIEVEGRGLLEEHVYFTVEDTAYFVTAVRADEASGTLAVRLSDEQDRNLELERVARSPEGHVYARLDDGEIARFDRHAVTQLAPWLETDGDAYWLRVGGRRVPIALLERSAPSPPSSA